ncbi:DUF3179 domain-containing (seleno)protein [Gymnodinialimonas hymeniacidonis]|uniref:DUF3179 domain-containing (seleno)protein n=1 Tax=Gymnodinialimonas hymeniacidonis TaxID=3126508 RepID=UPI0034C5CB2B
MLPPILKALALGLAVSMAPSLAAAQTDLPDYVIEAFGQPPAIPEGPLAPELEVALQRAIEIGRDQAGWDLVDTDAFETIAASGDPRAAWLITDLMRFTWRPEVFVALRDVSVELLGVEPQTFRPRAEIADHLIAWEVPAYPGYLDHKRQIFTAYLPGLEELMVEGDIDWHLVSWGGVRIDDRPYDTTATPCQCIPASDNPPVQTADEATWLDDDDIIFGIEINGEARAYPRQIMEVREMVNDTLGGRHLGMPYCTLCGAAQAYFTDELPIGVERPVLRTSGLLIRSNKVMYDITSMSVFDTFTGEAVTGPLAVRGLQLQQASVITTDWASWREAYPHTTVLVEELALGRDFDFRNTRDADGPIFPVGDVDPRLPVQEDVVGVFTGDGRPVAFPRGLALAALSDGAEVAFDDVRIVQAAGGLRAVGPDGEDLGSHEAFWFAWSQFHPNTALWPDG